MNHNNHTLSIYQKIGDIARQIESLEEKFNSDKPSITQGIGGIEVSGKDELKNMIEFQWIRLKFLKNILGKSDSEMHKERMIIESGRCNDCMNEQNLGCKEDFFNNCFLKLIEDMT